MAKDRLQICKKAGHHSWEYSGVEWDNGIVRWDAECLVCGQKQGGFRDCTPEFLMPPLPDLTGTLLP